MSFDAPLYLLALLVIPAVGLLWLSERRRRKRFAVRLPAAASVAKAQTKAPAWRRRVPPLFLTLAIAALALAMAKPQTTVAVPVEKASVMLVFDESGSMQADDVNPSRLSAAQKAGKTFLSKVPKQLLVGLVGYSDSVQTQLEPTTDHASITQGIDGLTADGGTATGDALTAALDRLQNRKSADGTVAPAAIILLSDGATTAGTDPAIAAARAAKLKIPISTVALGTPDGMLYGPGGQSQPVPPDPQTLAEIADTSKGKAYEVGDAGQLDKIYKDLGSRLGTRKQTKEISNDFVGGGLVFLLGAMITGYRRRTRIA